MPPNAAQSANQRFAPEMLDKVPVTHLAEVVADCLHATTVLKNGVVIPDWRTRIDAVKFAVAYMVGKPIDRVPVAESEVRDQEEESLDLEERMARSPRLLALFKGIVERAEARKLAECQPNWRHMKNGQ